MEEAILKFDDVAMLPQEGDFAALAKRLLPTGSHVAVGHDKIFTLTAPCLEGHRFAVKAAATGDLLLSWGLPFGRAYGPHGISPGDVLVNEKMAVTLKGRASGQHAESAAIQQLLKNQPVNFTDLDVSPDSPFRIEDHGFNAVGMNKVEMNAATDEEKTFLGYRRPHGRGVGTRNHVAVIALTASASPSIVPFASRWRHYETEHNSEEIDGRNFDGIRIVAHTEGESAENVQKNIAHIHRCIAGFLTHPNVGSAVVVTTGRERHVTRGTLMRFVAHCNGEAESQGCPLVYPLECFESPFTKFVQIHGGLDDTLKALDKAVLEAVMYATSGIKREPCPLSNLCIALQCGGSDAFSGLTGNPLAGDVAARFISSYAARAILAESPELIGAEPYILSRVADENVAKQFIRTTENYKQYGARHGLSCAGNPSGGNLYRGLYNIVLKSLGAARKKPPKIALDCVLGYGEPMRAHGDGPHYAFMDSPGNDLESIAGQVSSGCNLIIFITGNGAMTNFPFVPTIKVVTTSKRYELLKHEMDVDAGPYGHGGNDRMKAIDETFDLCVRIASGERSKGEAAGHSQVSIWRNWAIGPEGNNDQNTTDRVQETEAIDKIQLCSQEEPHLVRPEPPPLPVSLFQGAVERTPEGCNDSKTASTLRPWHPLTSFALIPTSLCSSAIATTIKDQIEEHYGSGHRFICPSHTEGCGAAGGVLYERMYQRLMLGHALHPSIGRVLFLEHGCEKTHNDYFRNCLKEAGVFDIDDPLKLASIFGFWSLQGGGGFENAQKGVAEYFYDNSKLPSKRPAGKPFGVPWCSRPVAVGLMVDSVIAASDGPLLASALATVVRFLSQIHVHTVLPINSPLISTATEESRKDKHLQGRCVGQVHPPTATSDMEDFFAPSAPKGTKQHSSKKQKTIVHASMSSLFAAEALVDATIPSATLLAGQMINQRKSQTVGLHVMDVPRGATWDETVSCLGPACDMMLLVAGSDEMSLLPGSCLSPALRRATPYETADSYAWHQWTIKTCGELSKVLRSPLVVGGDIKNPDEVISLQKSLFSITSFVIPRGYAVSF